MKEKYYNDYIVNLFLPLYEKWTLSFMKDLLSKMKLVYFKQNKYHNN